MSSQQSYAKQPAPAPNWVFNPYTRKYVNLTPLFAWLHADSNDLELLIAQELNLSELIVDLIPEKHQSLNTDIKVCLFESSQRRKIWEAMKKSECDHKPT